VTVRNEGRSNLFVTVLHSLPEHLDFIVINMGNN
jgi:hypothetical protein